MLTKVQVSIDSGKSYLKEKDRPKLNIADFCKCARPLFIYNDIDHKINDVITIIVDAEAPERYNPIDRYYLNYMCINDKTVLYLDLSYFKEKNQTHRLFVLTYTTDKTNNITKKTSDMTNAFIARRNFNIIEFKKKYKLSQVDDTRLYVSSYY